MAFSIRDLKRRMKSVKNTGQITRAMEAVSATKMRKAQQVALGARPYAKKALELLERLSGNNDLAHRDIKEHWLLEKRPTVKMAVVLVTSDKGLCGVLNANALRVFEKFISHTDRAGSKIEVIAIGKYGADYAKRRGHTVVKNYAGIGDIASIQESRPISQYLMESFELKQYDIIHTIYTNFVSTLRQEAVVRQALPLTKESIREVVEGIASGKRNKASVIKKSEASYSYEYKLEPDPGEMLNMLLPALVEVGVYHMLLEANASEHSARMLAMKNASDNAKDLLNELNLFYNKARQAGITREIAEITGGAAALEGA